MQPGPILAVTINTPDVGASVALYQRLLDYRLISEAPLPADLARAWGTADLAGRDCAVLAPACESDFRIRFVQGRAPADYVPFRHLGWNAAELLVQDVDALAERLADSDLRIIGPPADLSFSDQIRAMQVVGPANEVLYLTQIKSPLPQFDTPIAATAVDRAFIVILGGESVESLQDYYTTQLQVPRAPVIDAVITVISRAYGMPLEQQHQLAALPLAGSAYIEADAMPAAVKPRLALPGELPPAIAMVSFRCNALPDLPWLSPPARFGHDPYLGRRAAVCRGHAGELLELIEG